MNNLLRVEMIIVSYEINILAINQEQPIHLQSQGEILLHNERDNYEVNRYAEIWPFFSHAKGILYSIVTEFNEGFYSSYKLCDSDFEATVPDYLLPIWISEDAKYNITPLLIKDDMQKDFIKIVQKILESSPQKRVLFHSRYQGGDEEIILGTIKMSKFINMLINKEIMFNICYILEND